MKFRGNWSFWITLLFTAAVVAFLVTALSYGEAARLVPLVVGVPTLVLALVVLAAEANQRWAVAIRLPQPAEDESDEPDADPGDAPGARALVICGWIVGLFGLVFLVGFVVAVPVFVLLFLRLYARAGWPISLTTSIAMLAVIYGGFEILMKGDMFEGILFGGVLPPL